MFDAVLGNHINAAANDAATRILGVPSPGAVFHVLQCAAAVVGFVRGNAILAGRIRKVGNFVKVARR